MGNAMRADLHGKIVRLVPEAHDEDWRKPEHLLFKVEGGFGASATTSGRTIMGTYLCDGEQANNSGWDVAAIVEPEEAARILAEAGLTSALPLDVPAPTIETGATTGALAES